MTKDVLKVATNQFNENVRSQENVPSPEIRHPDRLRPYYVITKRLAELFAVSIHKVGPIGSVSLPF